MYLRTVKVPSSSGKIHQYVRIVQAYRQDGKSKQRVVADLGRKDVLQNLLPQLQKLLAGENAIVGEEAEAPVKVLQAATWGPMLIVRKLAQELGLTQILTQTLGGEEERGQDQDPVWASDRALVLIANRLIHPCSEHGLAWWLESDWVCDSAGRRLLPSWKTSGRVKVDHRQLDRWYRTLDKLIAGKERIEVALYDRLRDLFSLQVDLVLYDITSTYFEGAGPVGLAQHGYSRDGKAKNLQVVAGVVMVGMWPIAHHVFAGNTVDVSTVKQVVADVRQRFQIQRLIFVGDRGMVSQKNLEELRAQGQGYLVGLKRRGNPQVDQWLQTLKEELWVDCAVGITAREKHSPPRTRVQEVATEDPDQRVFVIDSEERRQYEQGKRQQSMQRTLQLLEKLKARVQAGKLKDPTAIGAAAQRALAAHHGHRYYSWRLTDGRFAFWEDEAKLATEKRLEGTYVIASSEEQFSQQEAVAGYKQLSEVERGFRSLKDVLALRPIWHHRPNRVKAEWHFLKL